MRAKKWPILWKRPGCDFDLGAGSLAGACAVATGPEFTVGPKPGAGSVATVAALSGVAMPDAVPVGTVCFGAV